MACEPACAAEDLQKLKVISTEKERLYFCRRCKVTWLISGDGLKLKCEELEKDCQTKGDQNPVLREGA